MVGDDTERNIHLVALAVGGAGEFGDAVGDIHHGVHIKQAVDILTDHSQTLQTHAGINVLLGKVGVIAVAVVVELGEYVVPDLHVSVTVAAYGAAGLTAAVFLAAVIVDLRAGAAGTGAMLPEVIGLAKTEDPILRNADVIVPDIKSLIIVQIDGGIQAVGIHADPFRAGQEFPAPCNGFLLEIIAEGEVAQHFKIGAVTGSFADVFNVAGTDALLAGGDTATGGLLLTGEEGLHGRHTGVDQQQRSVILGNQREASQTQMSLGFHKGQEHLTQFVESKVFHIIFLQISNICINKTAPAIYRGGRILTRYHPDLPQRASQTP